MSKEWCKVHISSINHMCCLEEVLCIFVRKIAENHLLQSSLKVDLEATAFNLLNVHSVTDDLLGFYRTNTEHFFRRTTVYFLVIFLEKIRVKLILAILLIAFMSRVSFSRHTVHQGSFYSSSTIF